MIFFEFFYKSLHDIINICIFVFIVKNIYFHFREGSKTIAVFFDKSVLFMNLLKVKRSRNCTELESILVP